MSERHRLHLIVLGGSVLSLVAGFVNVVSILGPFHQGVSHMTGVVSHLGIELSELHSGAMQLLAVLVAFTLGAVASGMLLESHVVAIGRRYGVLLLIEAGLLVGSAMRLESGDMIGVHLACAAMGMQNAMATRYSGAIVRTSHLTGVLTDIGLLLGNAIRGRPVEFWRLWLFAGILGGFLGGGVLGSWAWMRFGIGAMYLPAWACGVVGGGYWILRQTWLIRHRHDPPGPREVSAVR